MNSLPIVHVGDNYTVVRLKQCFLFENKRQHKNRSFISDMVRAKSAQQTENEIRACLSQSKL